MFLKSYIKLSFAVFAVLLAYGAFLSGAPTTYAATCSPTQAFKMTVKTDNPGTSNANSFTIQRLGTGYSYQVDINGNDNWSDTVSGFNEATLRGDSNLTIDFGSPGTYTISICGSFPRIYYNNSGDKDKILAVSQWGDNAWVNMSNAFDGATNMDVTATDTPNLSSLTSISFMFRNATSLVGNTSFNNWSTGSVISMNNMFQGASAFNAPIGNWDTSNATNLGNMFNGASSFNQDISGWDTGSSTSIGGMFNGATAFNQPLNSWNTSSVTNLNSIFLGASAFNQPLDNWDTSNVTTMNLAFNLATSFNQDISGWDVSNVTTMQGMFRGAYAFNQPLDNWDVSSVTNMNATFNYASSFNQPLNSWNVSSVTNMQSMFTLASSFNQPLNSWNVGSVTNMQGMFNRATSFNQPLNSWNVSNVVTMVGMFRGASSFNQPLGNWDVSNVNTMEGMFAGYNWSDDGIPNGGLSFYPMSFNQDLSAWDTSAVTNMFGMFAAGVSEFDEYYESQGYTNITITGDTSLRHPFNRSLGTWDMSSVTEAFGMLSGSSLSRASYDATLSGWSQLTLQSGVVLGAHSLEYCSGQAARQIILGQGWTLQGDSENCAPIPSETDGQGELAETGMRQAVIGITAFVLLTAAILTVLRKNHRYRYYR